MGESSAKSERWTAIASTIVAILILAAGVTASQHRDSLSPSDEVQQWESDLRFQVESVFRHDMRQRKMRLAAIDAVMAAWETSPQTAADRQLLLEWLSDAVVRSMPGTIAEFLPTPQFGAEITEHKPVPASVELPTEQSTEAVSPDPEIALTAPPLVPSPAQDVFLSLVTPMEPIDLPPTTTSVERGIFKQPGSVNPDSRAAVLDEAEVAPFPEPPSEASRTTSRQISPVSLGKTTVPAATVALNLTELSARIEGYHEALERVEMALLRTDAPTLEFLSHQVERLGEIARDYRFVSLYYSVLTSKERQNVAEPRSMEVTLREIERLLDRWQQQRNSDFLGSIDSSDNRQLSSIRKKLAELEANWQGGESHVSGQTR